MMVPPLPLPLPLPLLQPICGLPIHPYFSALKVRWLMENEPKIRDAVEARSCFFGTVDTWVIWVSASV